MPKETIPPKPTASLNPLNPSGIPLIKKNTVPIIVSTTQVIKRVLNLQPDGRLPPTGAPCLLPHDKSKRAAPPCTLPDSTRPIVEPPYPSFQTLPSESTRPTTEPPYPSFQTLPFESTRPITEPPYPSFQILPSESIRPTAEPPYALLNILPIFPSLPLKAVATCLPCLIL